MSCHLKHGRYYKCHRQVTLCVWLHRNGGGRVKYAPMKFNPDICRISPFTVMPKEFQCKPNHAEFLYDRWITLALRRRRKKD